MEQSITCSILAPSYVTCYTPDTPMPSDDPHYGTYVTLKVGTAIESTDASIRLEVLTAPSVARIVAFRSLPKPFKDIPKNLWISEGLSKIGHTGPG